MNDQIYESDVIVLYNKKNQLARIRCPTRAKAGEEHYGMHTLDDGVVGVVEGLIDVQDRGPAKVEPHRPVSEEPVAVGVAGRAEASVRDVLDAGLEGVLRHVVLGVLVHAPGHDRVEQLDAHIIAGLVAQRGPVRRQGGAPGVVSDDAGPLVRWVVGLERRTPVGRGGAHPVVARVLILGLHYDRISFTYK